MLEKHYIAKQYEQKLYQEWERGGYFKPCQDGRPAYSIVIPPPNVTGNLHMGHALNNCLQDVLIRYHRMAGYDCLWVPGTDHAGIATQMLVEKQMDTEGLNRHDLGREKFIERIWQWKEHSGGNILNQFRALGASVDWSRTRFTMDEGLSNAVLEVFVQLHSEGLIYKDTRLVNWDPVLETAISDLEVQPRETQGHLWHIKYPLEDGSGFITIATTRPETMLADGAVAVHPEDERYLHLHGKNAILPYCNRLLPIIPDIMADPEQGSGAVKISAAHDFNDFEFAKRHKIDMPIIFDNRAHLIGDIPQEYIGMERFAARKKIVQALEQDGLLAQIDEHTHMVPFGERSGVPVEPMLTRQWFVDAETLSKPAIQAVKNGKTKFYPENWQNTYFDWLENIQPWCISRQLWWGHQIPAWYAEDGEIFVAKTESDAHDLATQHYGKPINLTRDPDVLDTWFSSALWAFSPFGWPDDTEDLRKFFPTSVLITGFDIIFFWVARMMMITLHFTKQIPFETVYVHALVRDGKGQKMSKSKGNVIDPIDLIEKYGCDALRFTLASLAAPGRDIRLSEERIESSRNFVTKLWNAARFAEMRGAKYDADFNPATVKHAINRWIIHRVSEMADKTANSIETYRFHDAANQLYHFVWGEFCDWYLEFSKNLEGEAAQENKICTAWALEQILHLLHPFMPFVTSVLYRTGEFCAQKNQNDVLMLQKWSKIDFEDKVADSQIDWLMRLITKIRSARSELNIPASSILPLSFHDLNETSSAILAHHQNQIEKLARVTISDSAEAQKGIVKILHDEAEARLLVADAIDSEAELKRLQAQITQIDKEAEKIQQQLANQDFIKKAPTEIIEARKTHLQKLANDKTRLQAGLKMLETIKA